MADGHLYKKIITTGADMDSAHIGFYAKSTGLFQKLFGQTEDKLLSSGNNLSDVSDTTTARTNIFPSKVGNSLKVLRVNAAETDYELVTITATPGGANTNVQFNNSGSFGGSANFTWNNGTNALTVKGTIGLAGSTSGVVTIQPKAIAGTWSLTLPDSAGTAGYALQTDGSGITSWVAAPSGNGTTNYIPKWTSASALGNSQIFDNGTYIGIRTATPLATLHNDGSTLFTALGISDLPTGGNIGTAATTVDIYTNFIVTQTTAGQTITLPTPTNTTAGRLAFITNSNSSTVSFTVYGITVAIDKTVPLMWDGNSWDTMLSSAVATATASGWSLTGNTSTVDGTNFIGTTDNIALNFRVNNVKAGRLSSGAGATFFGYQAGVSGNPGNSVGIGYQALTSATTGSSNTAVGHQSLAALDLGENNTAVGYLALATSVGALVNFNTAVGSEALRLNTTGLNTAIGAFALKGNAAGATATRNTAIGYLALSTLQTGNENVAIGQGAGGSIITGGGTSIFIGYRAGETAVGASNTIIGRQTGIHGSFTGDNNIFLGAGTGNSNTTGAGNIFIGNSAGGTNATGNNNTLIGFAANVGSSALSNATAIGYLSSVTASNSLILGNGVSVGIGTTAPVASALLELVSTTKGFLPTRVTTTERDAISTPATGLLIYNTTTSDIEFYTGAAWVGTSMSSGVTGSGTTNYIPKWTSTSAIGNSILFDDGTNVGIGTATPTSSRLHIKGTTTDATAYGLKVDNSTPTTLFSVRNDGAIITGTPNQNLFIGEGISLPSGSGYKNTAIGTATASGITDGYQISAFGAEALGGGVVTGHYNCAFGAQAMYNNAGGIGNCAFGVTNLYYNVSGSYNTAFGNWVLRNNTSNFNTGLGGFAGDGITSGSNNVVLGYYAGYYGASTNRLFIDSYDRGNIYAQASRSLITGTFSTIRDNQLLTVNAATRINGSFEVASKFLELSSGVLVTGVSYTIISYQAGDDFTNVGASSNANGVTFTATGTTPTTWTNGTRLVNNTTALSVTVDNNVGIGTSTFGTSAAKVLGMFNGTVPSTSPADMFQLYSDDVVAGKASAHFRNEAGDIIKMYKETALTIGLASISHDAPSTPDYSYSGSVTNVSPYGLSTADEVNTLLSIVLNLQTRVNELESKLQSIGYLA